MTDSTAPLRRFRVSAEDAGQRLDRWLAARIPELSRTRLQQQILQGHVSIAGSTARPSRRIEAGDTILVEIPPSAPPAPAPEPIPLAVLHEDDDLIVLDKPAGMAVHPGAGRRSATLANALLYRYPSLSSIGGLARPGIVHRLDKDTSGVIVVARNDLAHRRLARQFARRRIEKTYLALLHGRLEHDTGRIDLPIARDLRRRTRMTTRRPDGRPALTAWRVLLRLADAAADSPARRRSPAAFTLVEAHLHTGRTHQLRVHFSALHHPVAGDTRYGAPRRPRLPSSEVPPLGRLWLHAARLRFAHPRTGARMEFRAPLPPPLRDWLVSVADAFRCPQPEIDRVFEDFL